MYIPKTYQYTNFQNPPLNGAGTIPTSEHACLHPVSRMKNFSVS